MTPFETDSMVLKWLMTLGMQNITPIPKQGTETQAWFASTSEEEVFLKLYPHTLTETWAAIEIAISGANLHPSIVPLLQTVDCCEGTLFVYAQVAGENLSPSDARQRFHALPLSERISAVIIIFEALCTVVDAGFTIVDWYEGNMIYDFDKRQVWLFDWELCRRGDGFMLEMDSNYGSSRLMAPEEFVRGSWLDQRTLVFNLGRYTLLTLPELADAFAPILARATYPARAGRYSTIREFIHAFKGASQGNA